MKYDLIEIPNQIPYKYDGPFSDFNGEPFSRLTKDATFIIKRTDLNRGFYLTIPTGFVTDFGTIPKWAQWLINARGNGERAYILHDWLCITGMCSYYTSDNILFSAMRYCGISLFQCILVRIALCVFHGLIEKIFPSALGLNYQDDEYAKLPAYTPIPDLF